MKKYIVMLLCAIFVVPAAPAYAGTKEEKSIFIEAACKNKNAADFVSLAMDETDENSEPLESKLVNYYALPKESLDGFYKNGNGYSFYGKNSKGVETEGTIRVTEDETIYLDIQEGNLKDEIVLSNDGKIYLDGNEVTYSFEFEGEEKSLAQISRAVARASDQWQTFTCPYGKASDYSVKKLPVKCDDIRIGKSIELVSETALSTILLGMAASLEADTGLWGFVSRYIVFDIIDLIKDLCELWGDNNTEHLSFEAEVYYHKNGHVVGSGLTVHKEEQIWYTQAGRTGGSTPRTVYSCHQFY